MSADEFAWQPGMRFCWVGQPNRPMIVVHASGRYVWWTNFPGGAIAGGYADLLRAKVTLMSEVTADVLARHIAEVEYLNGNRPLGLVLPTPKGER